jgi:hypothetical protein
VATAPQPKNVRIKVPISSPAKLFKLFKTCSYVPNQNYKNQWRKRIERFQIRQSTIDSFKFLGNRLDQLLLSRNKALEAEFSIDGDGGEGSGIESLKHGDPFSIPQTPLMVVDPISDFVWEVGYCCQHVDASSSLSKIGDEDINPDFFHLDSPTPSLPHKGGRGNNGNELFMERYR